MLHVCHICHAGPRSPHLFLTFKVGKFSSWRKSSYNLFLILVSYLLLLAGYFQQYLYISSYEASKHCWHILKLGGLVILIEKDMSFCPDKEIFF